MIVIDRFISAPFYDTKCPFHLVQDPLCLHFTSRFFSNLNFVRLVPAARSFVLLRVEGCDVARYGIVFCLSLSAWPSLCLRNESKKSFSKATR